MRRDVEILTMKQGMPSVRLANESSEALLPVCLDKIEP